MIFLEKVLELMMEKNAKVDATLLMTFRDFLKKEENIGKHYPLSLNGKKILDEEKKLVYAENEDFSNELINFLMYEMTNDCLIEIKKYWSIKRR